MTVRTCLCLLTRSAPAGSARDELTPAGRGGRELLLGYKKAGFGAGRWVGLGGHVEDDEEPADAAVREVAEESGLIAAAQALTHMATLTFIFPARPSWDQTADVFAATEFSGEPAESDELIPRWFAVDQLPFDGMWDDARYWLPLVLAGEPVSASITFADDCATVEAISPELPVLANTRRNRQL